MVEYKGVASIGATDTRPVDGTALLGDLLVTVRQRSGSTLDDLSATSGIDRERIAGVESGRHDLTADELSAVLESYGVRAATGRLSSLLVEVDLDGGWVAMRRVRRPWLDQPAADSNLLSYLCLLHDLRSLPAGSQIPLRSIDLSLLRASLAIRRSEVTDRLGRLDGRLSDGLRQNRSLITAAALAGVAVAAGAIILIPPAVEAKSRSGSAPAVGSSPTVQMVERTVDDADRIAPPHTEAEIEIGTALVVERDAAPAAVTSAAVPAADVPAADAPAVETESPDPLIDIGTALVIERPTADEPYPPQPSTPRSTRGPPGDTGGFLRNWKESP